MSLAEAERMDPQQRLFLSHAWKALEHAGYAPDALQHLRVGVWSSLGRNLYGPHLLAQYRAEHDHDMHPSFRSIALGNDVDFAATRVAFKLGLRGPAINVQTACSSSLVGVHEAAASIRAGECDMAIAGGVSLGALSASGYLFHDSFILSKTGRVRTFDADADGTVRGSGGATVVLKSLAQAERDGDFVWAVLAGSAVNNDGARQSFMSPSVQGQSECITAALRAAHVAPQDVGFIECHGTGTVVGDAIEVHALTQAYGARRSAHRPEAAARSPLALGGLKSYIGHLDAAAGVAGLIKAALVAHFGLIPPNLHLQTINPKFDPETADIHFPRQLTRWAQTPALAIEAAAEQGQSKTTVLVESGSKDRDLHAPSLPLHLTRATTTKNSPRVTAVSSFGIGATNAHAIVQQYQPMPSASGSEAALPATATGLVTLTFASSSAASLRQLVFGVLACAARHSAVPCAAHLRDVAWTLRARRSKVWARSRVRLSIVVPAARLLEHSSQPGCSCRGTRSLVPFEAVHADLLAAFDSSEASFELRPEQSHSGCYVRLEGADVAEGPGGLIGSPRSSPQSSGVLSPGAGVAGPSAPPIALWLFPGQGVGYESLGADLYRSSLPFQRALDALVRVLNQADWGRSYLALAPGQQVEPLALLAASGGHFSQVWSQLSLLCFSLSLARALQSFGANPHSVCGHSLGHYAAAAVAGLWNDADALRIVASRAAAMDRVINKWREDSAPVYPQGLTGAMLALRSTSVADMQAVLRVVALLPSIEVAARNSPTHVTLCGAASALLELQECISSFRRAETANPTDADGTSCSPWSSVELRGASARGLQCKLLPVSLAFHGVQMDAVLEEWATDPLGDVWTHVQFRPQLQCNLLCNRAGTMFLGAEVESSASLQTLRSPAYWKECTRHSVEFFATCSSFLDAAIPLSELTADDFGSDPSLAAHVDVLAVEMGPGLTCATFLEAAAAQRQADGLAPIHISAMSLAPSAAQRNKVDSAVMFSAALAAMETLGLEVHQLVEEPRRRRVPLPSFPFNEVFCRHAALDSPESELDDSTQLEPMGDSGSDVAASETSSPCSSSPEFELETAAPTQESPSPTRPMGACSQTPSPEATRACRIGLPPRPMPLMPQPRAGARSQLLRQPSFSDILSPFSSATPRQASPSPSWSESGAAVSRDQSPLPSSQQLSAADVERHVLRAFQLVLGSSGVGPSTDFFAAGGDSMQSIEVVARIKKPIVIDGAGLFSPSSDPNPSPRSAASVRSPLSGRQLCAFTFDVTSATLMRHRTAETLARAIFGSLRQCAVPASSRMATPSPVPDGSRATPRHSHSRSDTPLHSARFQWPDGAPVVATNDTQMSTHSRHPSASTAVASALLQQEKLRGIRASESAPPVSSRAEELANVQAKLPAISDSNCSSLQAVTCAHCAGCILQLAEAASAVTAARTLLSLPSIVLVHAIGGDVSGCLKLAGALTTASSALTLPVGRNVLALRARSLDADQLDGYAHSHAPHDCIKEQAAFYLRLLLQHQCVDLLATMAAEGAPLDAGQPLQLPRFLLGGHSYGGTAAYEIARQLEELRVRSPLIRWAGVDSPTSTDLSGLSGRVFALPSLPSLFMFDSPVYPALPLAAEMRDELDILYTVAGRAAGFSEEQWSALRVQLRDQPDALMAHIRDHSQGRVNIDEAIFRTWLVHLKALVAYRADMPHAHSDGSGATAPPSAGSVSEPRCAYSEACLFLTPTIASRFTGLGFHLPWLETLCRGVPPGAPDGTPGASFALERIPGDHYDIMRQTNLLRRYIENFVRWTGSQSAV